MNAHNPQAAQATKNKASGKGCLIALSAFGVVFLLSVIVGGAVIYKLLDSPEGRKIVSAVADTTKLTQEAMTAPGATELRKLGCDPAMIMDTERMGAIVSQFVADAGGAPLADKTLVMCQVGMLVKTAPTCEEVAKTYLAAVPSPAGAFRVQVSASGDAEPKCQKRYSQAGIVIDP